MHCFEAHFFDYNLNEMSFYFECFPQDDYSFHMAYNNFFDHLFEKFEFPIQSLKFNFYFRENNVEL